MKWRKLSILLVVATVFLTACNKKEAQQPIEPQQEPQQQVENSGTIEEEPKQVEEVAKVDNRFPVPIYKDGEKVVSINEFPEATQAALTWAYDFFHTEGIATEEEFFQLMKAKYRAHRGEIPPGVDSLVGLFAGYDEPMLPKFEPGQVVESFVVYPEVPVGLNIIVPTYIKLKGNENLHAIAISYYPPENEVAGANTRFPMALD